VSILSFPQDKQIDRIKNRESKILVVGLGKMGLPIAMSFTGAGFNVKGLDVLQNLVDDLNQGITTISEPGVSDRLKNAVETSKFTTTTDIEIAASGVDFVIIIIPVLIDDKGVAELEALLSIYRNLVHTIDKGTIIIQETTLPPGTTETVLKPIFDNEGKIHGIDYGLAFAPERTYSGRALQDIEENYPKVVGGVSEESGFAAKLLYEQVAKKGVIQVSNAITAEAVKAFAGTYRDVNIAIANQFAVLSDMIGIDIKEVIETANTEPYTNIHTPGIGVGGHCIPVYPYFIIQRANKDPKSSSLFQESRKINDYMVEYAINQISKYAADWNRNVLILGLAYRGGVKEYRLSPALRLLPKLQSKGAERVKIIDPLFSEQEINEIFNQEVGWNNNEWDDNFKKALEWSSIIIINTDHNQFKQINYSMLSNKVIFDGRYLLNEHLAKDFFLIQPGRELFLH
jgi:UDP-N-acetyl-D-mannosaminuronic acid dehydrogenase